MIAYHWIPRKTPLTPEAALASGETLIPMLGRIFKNPHPSWRGVAVLEPRLLVLVGKELPWLPGIAYYGLDPAAPSLYLPTLQTPNIPLELLRLALPAGPVLLTIEGLLVPLGGARPPDKSTLEHIFPL